MTKKLLFKDKKARGQEVRLLSHDSTVKNLLPYCHNALLPSKKTAFTLAEVLITLLIIGVVATVTLPILVSRINNFIYEKSKIKATTSIGEAWRLLANEGTMNSANDAEDFVKNYLMKKLKIVQTCSASSVDSLAKCGLPPRIKTLDGTKTIDMPKKISEAGIPAVANSTLLIDKNSPGYGFTMVNGYSVNLFYNPNCINNNNQVTDWQAPAYVCVNAIFDINGLKNPNQVGKDIGFITLLYPDITNKVVLPIVSPIIYDGKLNYGEAYAYCSSLGKDYFIPNLEELISISYNINLIGTYSNEYYWTSVKYDYRNYLIDVSRAYKTANSTNGHSRFFCVKK